jgi:hypothetical protein
MPSLDVVAYHHFWAGFAAKENSEICVVAHAVSFPLRFAGWNLVVLVARRPRNSGKAKKSEIFGNN